jgi:hypothetical protein
MVWTAVGTLLVCIAILLPQMATCKSDEKRIATAKEKVLGGKMVVPPTISVPAQAPIVHDHFGEIGVS